MSDISKINPNGTEYNLKDATARTNIGNLSNLDTTEKTDLVSAVNELKSGLTNLISVYTGVLPASASDTCYIAHSNPRAWHFLVETSPNVWQDLTEASYIQGNAIFVYMPSEKIAPHFGKNYRFVVI